MTFSSLITEILLLYCPFSWFCSLTWCLQVLICRNYMGDMDMNEIDHFMPILMKREEEAEMTPLVSHGPSHFLWIKHSNLYRIHVYITPLYKILLWMCLVLTTLGGLACSAMLAVLAPGLVRRLTSLQQAAPQILCRSLLKECARHQCDRFVTLARY